MAKANGRKVKRSTLVGASAERALRAFLEVGQMKQWWGVARGLVEGRKGGVYALAWGEPGQGYQFVVSGVLKSFQPGKRIRLEPLIYFNAERGLVLGPMRLSISVTEKGGKTRLSVRQDGYGDGPDWDWYYEAVVKGWKETLANVKAFLEGS